MIVCFAKIFYVSATIAAALLTDSVRVVDNSRALSRILRTSCWALKVGLDTKLKILIGEQLMKNVGRYGRDTP